MSVLPSINLLTNFPDVARQWHPTKNGAMKPQEFRPGSSRRVWRLCEQDHKWEAQIYNRTKGTRCPHCYRNRRKRPITN